MYDQADIMRHPLYELEDDTPHLEDWQALLTKLRMEFKYGSKVRGSYQPITSLTGLISFYSPRGADMTTYIARALDKRMKSHGEASGILYKCQEPPLFRDQPPMIVLSELSDLLYADPTVLTLKGSNDL